MFEIFFGMDACYGGSNCKKDAKITSSFCILTNFRIKASSRRIAETQNGILLNKRKSYFNLIDLFITYITLYNLFDSQFFVHQWSLLPQ